jgi:lipopolysaccharide transport system ATP-binding protein
LRGNPRRERQQKNRHMTEISIRVEALGKKYRIGARQHVATNWRQAARRTLVAPFDYLRTTLRGPSEEETLWALRDVSFEITRGETVAVIGHNGAGKSTLLKLLSRITEPSEGRAEVHGRVGSLLEVGTGFHKELTGRENVYMNAAILGMTRAEINARFDEIVAFAGVEKFIDTPVKRYSSGMHVRLGFAVAAHLEPEVLLVDEVLSVGDADFQRRCLGKMGEVAESGRTIMFVSHNMTAVASLCPRAILLSHGTVAAAGPTEEVIDQYLSLGRTAELERTWDDSETAPGDDTARLQRLTVKPLGTQGEAVTSATPLDITVAVNVLAAHNLNVRLFIKRISGETVFAVDSPQWRAEPGAVELTCHIPGNFMNDGIYTVVVAIHGDHRQLFYVDDAATFEVQDLAREGAWFGKWPGAVRPEFAWNRRDGRDVPASP